MTFSGYLYDVFEELDLFRDSDAHLIPGDRDTILMYFDVTMEDLDRWETEYTKYCKLNGLTPDIDVKF